MKCVRPPTHNELMSSRAKQMNVWSRKVRPGADGGIHPSIHPIWLRLKNVLVWWLTAIVLLVVEL